MSKFERIKRYFVINQTWLYAAFAISLILTIILILIYIPQGRLNASSKGDWKMMLPSELLKRQEDGTSFGYYDKCGDDRRCRSCKANLGCLECMNKCYNRYGPFYEKDNPRLAGAMLCSSECVEVAEEAKVEADLRFVGKEDEK